MRKGENAGKQHFLLFPQCFLPFPKQISIFQSHLVIVIFSSANAFNLDQSKILSFGKEVNRSQHMSHCPVSKCFGYERVQRIERQREMRYYELSTLQVVQHVLKQLRLNHYEQERQSTSLKMMVEINILKNRYFWNVTHFLMLMHLSFRHIVGKF